MPLHITRQQAPTLKQLAIAVYGGGGAGKTTFASKTPSPLYAEFDEFGCRALTDVDIVRNATLDDANDIVEAFERGDASISGYRTLVFDGLTTLVDRIVVDIAKTSQSADPRRHYALATEKLAPLLQRLIRLPVLKIITLHAKKTTEKDLDTNRDFALTAPHLPPALLLDLQSLVDCCLFVYTDRAGNRLMRPTPKITHKETIWAKDRLGLLGNTPLPLGWNHLMNKLQPPQSRRAEQGEQA